MSLTIQQSIARLSFTIKKGNKPNETDQLALNKVIRDLNANAKENVEEHHLFAKLYAIVLKDFTRHYKDVEFANVQLNKELSLPMGVHIELLRLQLAAQNVDNFFQSKGIKDPLLKQNNFETYKHLFPESSTAEFLEAQEAWDTDNTTAHLVNTVNQSILCFKK